MRELEETSLCNAAAAKQAQMGQLYNTMRIQQVRIICNVVDNAFAPELDYCSCQESDFHFCVFCPLGKQLQTGYGHHVWHDEGMHMPAMVVLLLIVMRGCKAVPDHMAATQHVNL